VLTGGGGKVSEYLAPPLKNIHLRRGEGVASMSLRAGALVIFALKPRSARLLAIGRTSARDWAVRASRHAATRCAGGASSSLQLCE